MKTSKAPKLILFALLAISAMPFVQAQFVSVLPIFADWSPSQLILALMYTTPAWTVAVLVFIQDSFRAEAMQEAPAGSLRSAARLGLLGLLTTSIALAINPVAGAASLSSLTALALSGGAVGLLCGGLLWPLLHHRQTPQPTAQH